VFRLIPNESTLELTEIAPGIDLERDILDQMEFTPLISPNLKLMNPHIFREFEMNMKERWFGKTVVRDQLFFILI
jgi:propionate CoA-transferase